MGDLMLSQEKTEAAGDVYQQGMTANPRHSGLMVRAAEVAQSLGRDALAVPIYDAVLTLEDNVVARNNLAMLSANRLPTEANLRKALSLMRPYAASERPALLDTLGWV